MPCSRLHHAASSVALAAILAFSPAALAQKAAAPDPAALALFEEGRNLITAGKVAEACPKFEQSVKITRTVGGMLNLADCYEQLGKTATAWATFREAEGFARDEKDVRSKVAGERAAALEGKLVKLTITVAAGADTPDLVVKRDGVVIPREVWGTAVPVDPGTHAIEASAPGKQTWSQSVEVKTDSPTVTVPALTAAAAQTPPPPPPPSGAVGPERPKSNGNAQRTLGIIVGGVGLAAIAVGSVGGIIAMNDHNNATKACSSYPSHCPPDHSADDPNNASQTWATVSTVSFIVAGVAVAAGAVLYLTAPKKGPAPSLGLHVAPAVADRTAGLAIGGAW